MTSEPSLTDRELSLLKVLVERYIEGGQPVGSRTLARAIRPELSPATIRNIMADLEEIGLVRSPHTSAGRVPTVHGYRVFVDSLLTGFSTQCIHLCIETQIFFSGQVSVEERPV